ncbi:HD-GYP domain-containing protein [Alteromonas sp. BL110]|uniref:HD-GYP domain-containing protein n=1 Tax=unclassified Alteromonas TaxID=2614992 RepID=UPI000E511E69|nr:MULTISPECIES: HD-GYP domain-containing protein [unclassified Alteromonas]AXT38562.1 HD-GYP domain-containing protein [Alteromonas sp. BL110]MCZ8530248.1 HD-GYP domain-containing protein [Alteromonas sp. PRIM-21]RKM83288.1 HD domain-containing protein [Alteromonas sp. BL110]
MIKKITIDQLIPGMFVHQILEQKGTLTVKSQGRVISNDVVNVLKKQGVKTLAIDTEKAFDPSNNSTSSTDNSKPNNSNKAEKAKKVSLENELTRASKLHEQGKAIQKLLLASVQKETPFDASIPKAFSSKLVESVDRNPDALLCLTKIREKDDYLLEHSLNVAILLANFGKFLGMSEEEVQDLSYAGFLHDLGKIKIPDEILHKPGRLTDSEMDIMKGHVKHGVDYLKETDIAQPLIQAISEHHERLDGLGYPAGTKGDDISKAGRMLAIADMYDALTADRVYKAGMSSQKAFSILMNDAPTRLDKSLVQQFIKCLGVYPVGSLVLLSNERLAMVLEQKGSPLTPLVKVFYSVRNSHYLTPKDIDLSIDKTVSITKAVIASDYKIDVNAFFERSVSVG